MSKSGVIVLEQRMVRSAVWLSLSALAMQVYLLFRCKCQIAKRCHRPGKRSEDFMGRLLNNGELVFTYQEAKRLYGITAGRFSRTIDELVEKGLLDITETGLGLYKMTTHYAISTRWHYWGTQNFESAKRPESSIKGCGFRKGNKLGQKFGTLKSSAAHGHGSILAMSTDRHGQKLVNRYNFCNGRYLCAQIT